MKKSVCYLIASVVLVACQSPRPETRTAKSYRTIDYVTVGRLMDSIRAPYVIDLTNGRKRLVFVGCDHIQDSTHAQFKTLQRAFDDLHPEISFNEGGQIRDSVHFTSLNNAAFKDGETGVNKFLCDVQESS